MDEDEQLSQGTWEEQSFEDYYSSQETEKENTDSEGEMVKDDGDEDPEIYVTRSGRKSRPPERLQYDAQACLLSLNDHEDQESWSEQHLLAFKASTDPDTMYHSSHETTRQREVQRSYAERM